MPTVEEFYKKDTFFVNFSKYGKIFNELLSSYSLNNISTSGEKQKKIGQNSNKNIIKSKKSIVRKQTNSSKQTKKVLRLGSVAITAFSTNSDESRVEVDKESEVAETRESSKSVYFGDRRSTSKSFKSSASRMSAINQNQND